MKTTIDIPEDILKNVLSYSNAGTKKEAILTAMNEYVQRRKMEKIASKLGKFSDFMNQSDLKKMRER